jgi:hypothetical protein
MRKLLTLSLLLAPSIAFADPSYNLKIDAPPAKKAQKGVAHIHITPGAGFHVNKDYPAAVKLSPPAGVTVDPTKKTIDEQALDFEVAYTSTDSGQKIFTGDLKFAVCSASSCDPKKEKLNFTVDVK